MKRILILFFALVLSSVCCFAQEQVERWGCYEVSLQAAVKGNPFDVQLAAVFTNGADKVEVRGFYDGSDSFKLRFMPLREGRWTYSTSSKVSALNRRKGSFECVAPSADNHGPVVPDGTNFKYADGSRYYPVGTTSYDWMHVQGDAPQRTIVSLKESGFNKIRCLFFLQNLPIEYPEVYPFEKEADGSWDYDRFNPAYFQYVEKRIEALRGIGVEADLILFHPYDGGRWGFNKMPLEVNLRYLSYITARFAAFRNIWWSLANEFDGVKGIPLEDWDKFAQAVDDGDPYGHLLSIHGYTATYYDYWKPVFTHTSIQDQAPVEGPGRAATVLNIYKKPVIFDEVCYEGNIPSRWGCLSGEEMLFRMYNGLMAGTYVTHAECFNVPGEDKEGDTNYLAYGREFHGESWKRIKFLRAILDALPQPLGLADKSWDPGVSTAGDGYYLIYRGKEIDSEWRFELPVKNALTDTKLTEGLQFKVEILDTWNMTVTECPTVFETGTPDRYRISDVQGRAVRLPDSPYLLLRITKI